MSERKRKNQRQWLRRRREEWILDNGSKKRQVLCHDCHWEKTKQDNEFFSPCGKISKYRKGCRCDECREAHRIATNEYRWKTGRRNKRKEARA